MKKTARQVIRSWNKTIGSLKPGETLQVTKRGEPYIEITKAVTRRRKLPDFAKAARADRAGAKVGDRILKRILAAEALS